MCNVYIVYKWANEFLAYICTFYTIYIIHKHILFFVNKNVMECWWLCIPKQHLNSKHIKNVSFSYNERYKVAPYYRNPQPKILNSQPH